MTLFNRYIAGLATISCAMAAPLLAADAPATEETKLQNKGDLSPEEIKKVSTALGYLLGRNLNTPGINFDLDSVIAGMRDGNAGKPAPMSDTEFQETMDQLQRRAYEKLAENNLKIANEYLHDNAKKEHIVEIEPGKLQYLILEEGKGTVVDPHGTPQINYTGKYADGTVFNSSADVGGPVNIPLEQTIPGFSKGIQGMKEGEKRRLFIHPDLGYGTSGQLPPNSLLIFDIEVIKAEAPKTHDSEEDLMPLSLDDDESDEEEAKKH